MHDLQLHNTAVVQSWNVIEYELVSILSLRNSKKVMSIEHRVSLSNSSPC